MVTRKQVCGFFHPDEQTSSSNVQLHNFCTWIALDKDKADWQELSAKVTSAPEHFSRILHRLILTLTDFNIATPDEDSKGYKTC